MVNLTPAQEEVLFAFAENNMNATDTSRQIHLHRNTVIYHLSKIHESTGLNPHKFYDLVQLLKLCNEEKEGQNESN